MLDRLLQYHQYLPVNKIKGISDGQHEQYIISVSLIVIGIVGQGFLRRAYILLWSIGEFVFVSRRHRGVPRFVIVRILRTIF